MKQQKTARIATALAGSILGILFLFPLYVLAVNSFKTQKGIFKNVLAFPSTDYLSLKNYPEAFEKLDFIQSLGNSLLITIVSTILIVVLTAMAAWVLVRYKMKLSTVIFMTFATAMLIPFQCVMLPLVRLMSTPSYITALIVIAELYIAFILSLAIGASLEKRLGKQKSKLISYVAFALIAVILIAASLAYISGQKNFTALNRFGLIFMYIGFGASLSIILFHGFIKNVPLELEEAATIDGCSPFRTFWQVVFPLLKTIAITVAILNIMWIWNDFLLPQLTINKAGWQTIPLKTYFFFGQFSKRWDLATAGLIMGMLPIVVFYLFCQKYIVKGITDGAIK